MFANKVVLITGAGSGIGACTALEFAKLNAKLALTGRNESNLANIAKQCEEVSPSNLKPFYYATDITMSLQIDSLINRVIKYYKGVDVLVNNAAIMAFGSIEDTCLEQYDEVFATNLRGPYYLTLLVIPYLIKSKGNIVNVSSVAGLRSFSGVLAYCMSKSSLDQFTRSVSIELGKEGVRVNSVNPGAIETGIHLKAGMSYKDFQLYLERSKDVHALGRIGTTQEVAQTIVFLASDAASNITGTLVPVDGGRHAMCPH